MEPEISEMQNDMQRKYQRDSARANKVSTFLNDNFYRTDKTFPFLFWPLANRQVSVSMFFPKKNLAIDKYPRPTEYDRKEVEFKRSEFKKHDIKYLPMFPETKLMELADFL